MRWEPIEACTLANEACVARCEQGEHAACFTHAILLQQAGHDAEAQLAFERGCVLGHSLSCVNRAADLFFAEPRSSSGIACARRLFDRACDAKDSMGCMMVARTMLEGEGPPDRAGVKAYLEAKCAKLNGPPCRLLAYYLEIGELGPADASRSADLLRRACEGGDPDACGDPPNATSTFGPR